MSSSLRSDESRPLGITADAAWREHAHLAGVGSLLPAWRQIAQLLAPLCHQVCQAVCCTLLGATKFPAKENVAIATHRQVAEVQGCAVLQRGLQAGLRVSLLLHGPSGSGKSTAVRAAAAALGLHVIPYSCHEFSGQADTVAATAVRAAFRSARTFSPVVLLLQDIGALSDALSGAPSGCFRQTCCSHMLITSPHPLS